MSNYITIQNQIKSEATNNLLARALGYSDVNDTRAVAEAKKYASSVLTTIEADPKLHDLEPRSVVLTMIDAAKFKLEIDGRKLAYLVPYGGKATLQISFKGFLAKLKEHYPDMSYTAEMVFDGDKFDVRDEAGYQTYTHIKADPFQTDMSKLKGVFVSLAWTENGTKQQKINIVPKSELDKMKAKSRGSNWSDWHGQMAIKSAIKRACKVHFAALLTLADMAEYDNKVNSSIKTDPVMDEGKPNIIDNLNEQIVPKKAVIDVEEETDEVPI